MATLVPHANLARILGTQVIESEAASIRELLAEIRARMDAAEWERTRRVTILVNGVAIHRLSGLDTPLNAGDQVWMVVPSGGG